MVEHLAIPDAGTDIVPLAIPVYAEGGRIRGMAIALGRAGDTMHYLVVPHNQQSAPVWVSERDVDVARIGVLPERAT